jgi:hypothetical protein
VALTPQQRTSATQIAGLTLVNAMVFHEVLSGWNPKVKPLRKAMLGGDPVTRLAAHWEMIETEIDYVPIFHVARELLLELPASKEINAAIKYLADRALEIVSERAALRHDLMGRVYHRLLAEAKYLGTYYTSVPAATLLLKLALDSTYWQRDWSDEEQIANFKIADLACGTGTLLMAAAEAVTDNYVHACVTSGVSPDLGEVHRLLMEDVIHGYDVLPSALHLTASTLALRASAVVFDRTNLWSLPLGGPHKRLGSVEFLSGREVFIIQDLFGELADAAQVTGGGDVAEQVAVLPDLDLCVMNPPFTRSVGGNLLFGSVPKRERTPMQKELAKLLKATHAQANSTAGLGSVFVAAADPFIKQGGRLALVLPKALLSGVAWSPTRDLIAGKYRLDYVVASHDPTRVNFSDNTDLSETLVVATKVGTSAAKAGGEVRYVNLWRNPRTSVEALQAAQEMLTHSGGNLAEGQGAVELRRGNLKLGEVLTVPWDYVRGSSWMLPAAFAQSELVRVAYHLAQGDLCLPGDPVIVPVPVCALGDLGTVGPDRRDIHDGFDVTTTKTPYAALWGHDAQEALSLARVPNRYLSPLAKAKKGRPLRKVEDLWPRSGRIVLGERLWLVTQRVVAVHMSERVLGNVWWPFALAEDDERVSKALVLWLNSTLGLMLMLAHREETRGAWVAFKKPVLTAMPVLDPRQLSSATLATLAERFDEISGLSLNPFPQMESDPARAMIDAALMDALGLPDVGVLRSLLGQEPVISMQPLD